MFIEHTSDWFRVKNPLYKVGQYTRETDTGITKQGVWDGVSKVKVYYNNLPSTNVNTVGQTPVSAGVNNSLTKLTIISGTVDGVNMNFTFSDTPTIINQDTQMLIYPDGYSQSGASIVCTNPPTIGIVAYK